MICKKVNYFLYQVSYAVIHVAQDVLGPQEGDLGVGVLKLFFFVAGKEAN
jgi:hypothetical protein